MTVHVLDQFHRATETIVAVYDDIANGGGYKYSVRFIGGKHNDSVIRCHTEESATRLFDQAVWARKQGKSLWWLGD